MNGKKEREFSGMNKAMDMLQGHNKTQALCERRKNKN